MAALAGSLIANRAWERLGFARLRDYAVERLGVSARSLHDLAHVHGALTELPGIDAAFQRDEIPWTKARLLARVATAADEAEWLDRARRMSAAALAHEVRKVDVGAIGRSSLDPDDDEETKYENVRIRCTPQVQGKWHRARQLAWRVVGHPVRPWECAELVAAEVLSALPADRDADDGPAARLPQDAGGGNGHSPGASLRHPSFRADGTHSPGCNGGPAGASLLQGAVRSHDEHGGFAEPLALVESLVENLQRAGSFQLDRRLRRAVRLEQRLDADIGARLALGAREHLHLAHGFSSFEDYVREHLGMAPRKVRALLRLERASHIAPALGNAYREGRLSWVQAHTLIPVVLIARDRAHRDGWIRWAMQVSFRRLQDDVEKALLLNETHPEEFARTAGLPATAGHDARSATPASSDRDAVWTAGSTLGAGDTVPTATRDVPENAESTEPGFEPFVDRQIGAQPRVSAETTYLFFHAPREIAGLFRAVLCIVRRAIERQTGRMPTEGEAFEAMLDHAADAWMPPGSRVRAAHRVFARDGWRCTAPGCSSYRNLHDHHIVFRSAGGSDDLDNRTTLCVWHHLRGVHAGVVRCAGKAPHALRFELGLRGDRAPLLSFGPGERLEASRCAGGQRGGPK